MKMEIKLDEIEKIRLNKYLELKEKGFKLKHKRTRPRNPEKQKLLVEFALSQIPPADDILSGKYFREILKEYLKEEVENE